VRLVDNSPVYLGCLLESYLDNHHAYHAQSFSFEMFSKIYNCNDILNRLERFGDRALSSLASQQAAKLFRQRYTNSEQGCADTSDQAEVSEAD
jgi:hypothetical protein